MTSGANFGVVVGNVKIWLGGIGMLNSSVFLRSYVCICMYVYVCVCIYILLCSLSFNAHVHMLIACTFTQQNTARSFLSH